MFLSIILYYYCSQYMYVNTLRKTKTNPKSFLKVVDSMNYDVYDEKKRGCVVDFFITCLLVFKVKIFEYLCTKYTFKESEIA